MIAWSLVALFVVLVFIRAKYKIDQAPAVGLGGPKDLDVFWHYGVATIWSLGAIALVAIFT